MRNVRKYIHFCMWGKCPTSFFYMWLCICPSAICWNVYVLISPLILAPLSWHSCWKSFHHGHMGLFLDSQFYFINLCVLFPVLLCLDYCCVLVSFDTEKCDSSNSVLQIFSRLFWLFLGPFDFYMNFRIRLSISAKNKMAAGILRKVVVTLLINFWDYCHQNNVKYSYPWAWDVFPCV